MGVFDALSDAGSSLGNSDLRDPLDENPILSFTADFLSGSANDAGNAAAGLGKGVAKAADAVTTTASEAASIGSPTNVLLVAVILIVIWRVL